MVTFTHTYLNPSGKVRNRLSFLKALAGIANECIAVVEP